MKTIEVSYANRRKEKLSAEVVSLTDAPGWVVLKTDGSIVEMISASTIKRLKVVADDALELAAPVMPVDRRATMQPRLLRMPAREVIEQSHLYSPLAHRHA